MKINFVFILNIYIGIPNIQSSLFIDTKPSPGFPINCSSFIRIARTEWKNNFRKFRTVPENKTPGEIPDRGEYLLYSKWIRSDLIYSFINSLSQGWNRTRRKAF